MFAKPEEVVEDSFAEKKDVVDEAALIPCAEWSAPGEGFLELEKEGVSRSGGNSLDCAFGRSSRTSGDLGGPDSAKRGANVFEGWGVEAEGTASDTEMREGAK